MGQRRFLVPYPKVDLGSVPPCAVLSVTDTFTDTNGVQIEAHGAPDWGLNTAGSLDIQSNGLAPDSFGAQVAARWISNPFCNDQYSQAVLVAATASRWIGVAVRCLPTGAQTYYGFYSDSNNSVFFKMLTGVFIPLSAELPPVPVSTVMRIEAQGLVVRVLLDSAEVASAIDGDIVSGSAGVCGFGDTTASQIDSWEGGNL